tara:strand:+ start:4260 stop:5048 length:789 start_codon:yes stop_codon:yes gene_type:complete
MESKTEPTFLAKKNAHPRDSHILFEEGPHIYTIDGDSNYLSVTTWNHSHFPHFDSEKIINKMMASPKWPDSKYYGMKKWEIKKLWRDNGREAAKAGTKMHYDIECFYNNMEVTNDSTEFTYFKDFHEEIGKHMLPYRTEWMIYDKELRFAGSIDMIFENDDGTLEIYDWKRCKEIKKTNAFENAKTECISYMPNCNFWHYSLQLNTYKALIEKNYGKVVNGMYLVCLHPNNNNKNWLRFKVPDLSNEINDLFELRKQQLNNK